MPELVKINNFLNYIDKTNAILKSIKYRAKIYPMLLDPMTAIVIGCSARRIALYLLESNKAHDMKEVILDNGRKIYTVDFSDRL